MNLKISIYALLTLKKPQTESAKEKERRSMERAKGNEKSTRCEGGRQEKKHKKGKMSS